MLSSQVAVIPEIIPGFQGFYIPETLCPGFQIRNKSILFYFFKSPPIPFSINYLINFGLRLPF